MAQLLQIQLTYGEKILFKMIIFIKVLCIILAVIIVALVLLQQGKGSDLGSAFGGGSSNSMFGALGPSDFLGRLTYYIVAIWLVLSMLLAYLYKTENSEVIFDTPLIEEAVEEGLSDEIPIEQSIFGAEGGT